MLATIIVTQLLQRPFPRVTALSSPSWELELRPLGVAMGNALSVTRV